MSADGDRLYYTHLLIIVDAVNDKQTVNPDLASAYYCVRALLSVDAFLATETQITEHWAV